MPALFPDQERLRRRDSAALADADHVARQAGWLAERLSQSLLVSFSFRQFGAAAFLVSLLGLAAYPCHALDSQRELWVLADVDGDERPDLVQAQPSFRNGHWVVSSISATRGPTDIPRGAGLLMPLRLLPHDLDHDSDLDLVVYDAFRQRRVGLWINDGEGHFTAGDESGLSRNEIDDTRRFLADPPRPRRTLAVSKWRRGAWLPAALQVYPLYFVSCRHAGFGVPHHPPYQPASSTSGRSPPRL